MKKNVIIAGVSTGLLTILTATGCRSDYGVGSPYQPGPVAGKAVGTGVGVVEGTAHGIGTTFDSRYHMVRVWQTETTADGRTIQVPRDILVDQYGRPAAMPAPTGNPAPAKTTNAAPSAEK